jgi:hypothetical protein
MSVGGGLFIHPNDHVNLGFKHIDLTDGELTIEGIRLKAFYSLLNRICLAC